MEMNTPVSVVYVGNTEVHKHIKDPKSSKRRLVPSRNANKLANTFIDAIVDTNQPKVLQDFPEKPVATLPCLKPKEKRRTSNTGDGSKVFPFKAPVRLQQMLKFAESAKKKCYEDGTDIVVELSSQKHLHFGFSNNGNDDSSDVSSSDSDDELTVAEDKSNHATSHHSQGTDHNTSKLTLTSDRELYFNMHSASKTKQSLHCATSNRTLQRLKNPQMEPAAMAKALQKHEKDAQKNEQSLDSACCHLLEQYNSLFPKWMNYLCNGFNLLLYGLGTKRKLVLSFCEKMLKGKSKVIVNGFFPNISIKTILSCICEDILQETSTYANIDAQIKLILQKYSSVQNSNDLFIIIHNIDGLPLRNSLTQNILSRLAELPCIHVLATIDHINAPLIWDQTTLSRFQWLWHDVTTYLPYSEETSYEGSLLLSGVGTGFGAHGAALALSGLLNVAKSLTSNARGVFRFLAEHELSQTNSSNSEEVVEDLSFSVLYQKCREKFLVNSELTLRAHLTEFIDHKLVQIKKGADGNEYLSVPLGHNILKEYLEQESCF